VKPSIVILDPGHGMGNRRAGRYDPGAVAGASSEAAIAMDWANELRDILRSRKVAVVRTRVDAKDPAPVAQRAATARRYKGDIMLSLHCNAAGPTANGTETFYRGTENKAMASRINQAVVDVLQTRNRGAKTEDQSQHGRLAVMSFQPCFLLELGFITHVGDRSAMLDPNLRYNACLALADVLVG
jgi:N-acetylmuramoyl-L-alanine amidase